MADSTSDSADLEALFDSIAFGGVTTVPPPAPPVAPPSSVMAAVREGAAGNDSADLEALFDSVVAQSKSSIDKAPVNPTAEDWDGQTKAFNTVGHMVRQLHDALLGLGYDKLIEKTVTTLPDAKDRLAYVASLTEQAACRVLNATDVAMPIQEQLGASGQALADRWDRVYANQTGVDEFKQLADDTRAFLKGELPQKISLTSAQLMEIMMAQDFQDLTGQVIKKIVTLAQEMESSMTSVLIDIIPEMKKTDEVNSLLNGPVINAEGRADVVVGQTQVDDLLDSLGF
jgi:chemotaxis protein CheZ